MKKKWMVVSATILLAISFGIIIILVQKKQRIVLSFEVANNIIQYTADLDGLYAVTTNGEVICYPIYSTESYVLDKTDVIYCDMLHQILIKKNGDIFNNITATEEGDYIGTIPGAVSCSKFEEVITVLTDTGELYVTYNDLEEKYKVKFGHTETYDDWLKINDFGEVKKVIVANYEIYVLNMQGEYYDCNFSIMPKKIEVDVNIADVYAHFDDGDYILDTEGNLYQCNGYIRCNCNKHNLIFGNYIKMDCFQELTRVKIDLSRGLALSKQNTLYVWAREFNKKGLGVHVEYIYDEIENFDYDDFFLGGDYIYS